LNDLTRYCDALCKRKIEESESRRWRRPRPVTGEYTTHSKSSRVKVYKDDQRIFSTDNGVRAYRARQLYKNISMLFLFPVTRDLLFTNM